MEDEFITYGTARIMLSNVTYDMAANLAAELASIDGVTSVSFGTVSYTHLQLTGQVCQSMLQPQKLRDLLEISLIYLTMIQQQGHDNVLPRC